GRIFKLYHGTLGAIDTGLVIDNASAGKGASDDLTATPQFDRTNKRVTGFFGEGALARKNAVDLATADVSNKSADNIAESGSRKWAAETGAQVFNGKSVDLLVDGTTYKRVGAAYVDSGRVVNLWDGTAVRSASAVWTGAARATAGLDASGGVAREVPPAKVKDTGGLALDKLRPPQEPDNLLLRGDFTSGADPWVGAAGAMTTITLGDGTKAISLLSSDGQVFERPDGVARDIPCEPGDEITLSGMLRTAKMLVNFRGLAGHIWQPAIENTGFPAAYQEATFPAPAGTTYCRIILQTSGVEPSGYALNLKASRAAKRVARGIESDGKVKSGLNDTDRFIDSPTYARIKGTEQTGGERKRGIAGSGKRVGDQRNLPQSNVNTLGSVPSATALSATAAGAISVNAHTTYMGGSSVAYSAVANAITGKAQSTTWVVYCLDPDYAGGAQAWLAASTMNTAMQAGDGVYIAGIATLPTSGTGSGGT